MIESIVKVKAHRDADEEGTSARERRLRSSNRDADAGAKHGLQLHPTDAASELDVDALVTVARAYCILAANVVPPWPKLPLDVPICACACRPKPGQDLARLEKVVWYLEVPPVLAWQKVTARAPPGRCSNSFKFGDNVPLKLRHRVIGFHCSDGSMLFIGVRKMKCHSTGRR
eukprot:7034578-Pyramimonas_sp.AAC.1